MKKVILLLSIILGCLTFSNAQSNLNDYKYVIVPNKFDFLKEADKYQLNSLTKFLFNKYGFTALMENENYPEDLAKNVCLGLRSDVISESGFFKTKLKVELKNCKSEIIYTSEVGETKEKDYAKAYNLALRSAFNSFETVNYKYKPIENVVSEENKSNIETIQEIEKLKEEINTLKEKQTIVVEPISKTKKEIDVVVEEAKDESFNLVTESNTNTNILYAQEIDNGFQVVDSTPKVLMILLSTPKQDAFIVKGRDAIVYKEDGFWYLSENNGTTTTTNTLNIKF